MSKNFVHLHTHSQYSLLRGMIRVPELVARAKELGQTAIALTDHHQMFGAIDFYFKCKEQGIKPILGTEVYYLKEKLPEIPGAASGFGLKQFSLVILAKNLAGYRNLSKILTDSYRESHGKQAIVTRELLKKYSTDLIVLQGGVKSEIGYSLLTGKESDAMESLKWFKSIFKDDFYCELQDISLPEQEQVNDWLYTQGKKLGIKSVATSNAYYLEAKDAEAHEVLQCIELGKNLDFDRPKSLVPQDYWLKSTELMYARMERFEGACEESVRIAEKIDIQFKFKDEKGNAIYHLPNFRPDHVSQDEPFDLIAFFKDESRKGLAERKFPIEQKPIYEKRLEEELSMIEKTGFASYFLIVADFINWAKRHNIPVGPGRGSGAGSLVAYALKITDVDPIRFQLLFERFINPERVSLPDFDVDFCQDRRGEVIEYVNEKYGRENVSQIITYGKLQTKQVIKDVARVLGLSFADSMALTKLVPEELNIKLKDAVEKEPELQRKIESDPQIAKLFEYAFKLEGLYRSAGMHAAGVIITEEPIVNYCPLFVNADGDAVTQFDKDYSEKIGLVKFDFLGLKTLTVIDHAVQLIRAVGAPGSEQSKFRIEEIPLEDKKVFDHISTGHTDGMFQIEGSGMKDLCVRLEPNSIEDITAINALFRPGPLGSGMVDEFIECKHGRKPIEYALPALEPILKETYGIILYQEQVMQIARELAGYTLGQADMLRRAMGKKKADEMARHRATFSEGAAKKGHPVEKAQQIFDLMEKFAEYGFNKSHSAAYALITYQTAYLKTYYPEEFMAALLTTEMDKTEKLTKYLSDVKASGIEVLPPNINKSFRKFTVEVNPKTGKKAVRFGLEAIKGVGGAAVENILEARAKDGPFVNMMNFCKRITARKVNKKVLESTIIAGCYDEISEVSRATLFNSIDAMLDYSASEQEERDLGQISLFDSFKAEEIKQVVSSDAIFKQAADWPAPKRLSLEKQILGFYISGHPMDTWQSIGEDWLGTSLTKIKEAAMAQKPAAAPGKGGWNNQPKKKEVKVLGLFTGVREVMSKKGKMGIATFEDLNEKIEVVFFSDAYAAIGEKLRAAIANTEVCLLVGDVDVRGEQPQLIGRTLDSAQSMHESRTPHVVIKINNDTINIDQMRSLKKKLLESRGKSNVTLHFQNAKFSTKMDLSKTVRVNSSPEWIKSVNELLGPSSVQLK